MACFEHGTIIELSTREVVTLPDLRSATLRVTRGTLWITQEGDPQDVVLRAGDSWTVERNGLTVVEAQDAAVLCVVGRRLDAQAVVPRRGAPHRLGQLREAIARRLAMPPRGAVPYY